MKNFSLFIEKNFNYIVIVFLFLIFFKTCNRDTKILNKKLDKLTTEIQSLKDTSVTKTDLMIEGLKAEKRMIQSVDRRMIDVKRQTEIDNEIKRLQGE
jgi:hypothetical protein